MTTYARPEKHSLTLSGHRTSVTMEAPFWRAFRNLARAEGVSVNALAARIDAARPLDVGLASAIRVHVLAAALRDPSALADSDNAG
ncbi:ribbon-helix-helix domain-containing protein [Pikeienuella sp. HZG-20]|uniref:ribbon-helix-helix domain-containing protein n=1 Tax=Paludibacillus litoralis TaxID=3133267 RepID=UPI0030EE891F